MWEFHDRLFHRQTRRYQDFQPYGGTYRFRAESGDEYVERLPSPPAIRPPYDGDTIELPVPEPTAPGHHGEAALGSFAELG